jgi:hypothetical protein
MSYPLSADGGPDDLPRTLRREKEAREREAREREAAERALNGRESLSMETFRTPEPAAAPQDATSMYATPNSSYMPTAEPVMPASVQRFDVPFMHLIAFFLKAVLAAIPALILLTAVLWVGGQIVKIFFPWLLKAQILIHFPN